MTHRAYTVTLWCCAVLLLPGAVATLYAVTAAGALGAVYAGGPLTVLAGSFGVAYLARRELRASHVGDLAEANTREERIART